MNVERLFFFFATLHWTELLFVPFVVDGYIIHGNSAVMVLFIVSVFSSKVCAYYRCRMRWCPNSLLHLLRCVRLQPCTRRGRSRLPLWIREILAYMSMLVQSLYFNSLTDSDVIFDSIFEPLFWTVDYVTRWFGTVGFCLSALVI